MAWVNILVSRYDTDSAITQDLFGDIVNNFDGLANGDAGAPKIQLAAMDEGSINGDKCVQSGLAAGIGWLASTYLPSGIFLQVFANASGFYRVQWNSVSSNSTQYWINGAYQGVLGSGTNGTGNVSLSKGDKLSVLKGSATAYSIGTADPNNVPSLISGCGGSTVV